MSETLPSMCKTLGSPAEKKKERENRKYKKRFLVI
jgi:hypothetical protein